MAQQTFRSALNGFHREDVVRYIEFLNAQHAAEITQLNSELASAKAAELGVSGFDALPDTHKYGTATTCNTLTRTGYTISAWADEAGTALASKQIAAKAYSYDVNGKDYVIKV